LIGLTHVYKRSNISESPQALIGLALLS